MAVVPGGFFGSYFQTYQLLKDERVWNTKDYDYPIVRNAGQTDKILRNEDTGTGLLVEANKYGYFDTLTNGFHKELSNPVYQLRDSNGNPNNRYYIDQKNGDVYFRPDVAGAGQDYIAMPDGTAADGVTVQENGFKPIDGTVEQYFGTTFDLTTVPNPEDFGQGQANNIDIINQLVGREFESYEAVINGVRFFVGGTGQNSTTSTIQADVSNIPGGDNPEDALFHFVNSFTGGAPEFAGTGGGSWTHQPGTGTPPDGYYTSDGGNNLDLSAGTAFAQLNDADNTALDISGTELTMEAWVYYTGAGGSNMILNKESSYEFAINSGRLSMAVETAGPVGSNAWFWTDRADVTSTYGGPTAVPVNTWTHVAGVYDGTEFRLYMDGNLVQSVSSEPSGAPWAGGPFNGNIVPSNNNLNIGARGSTGTSSWFSGQIDEVRISDTVRYTGGSYTVPSSDFSPDSNTAGLWHFDDALGSNPVVDSSGNSLVGTALNNGAVLTDNNPSPIDGGNSNQMYFKERTADNFVLKTDIRVPKTSGEYVDIQFRADEPTASLSHSGYTLRYYENGNLELYKALSPDIGLGPGIIATGTAPALSTTTYRSLELHANGTNIYVNVDGAATGINVVDDINNYTDGYLIYRTSGNNAMDIDNFQLTGYNQPIHLLYNGLRKGKNYLTIKGYADTQAAIKVDTTSAIAGIDLSTTYNGANDNTDNYVPDLALLHQAAGGAGDPLITNELYQHETISGIQTSELLSDRAYWSASVQSALGVVGKLEFINREGGTLRKVAENLSSIQTIMQDLNSLLGADLDLFESHLNVIR